MAKKVKPEGKTKESKKPRNTIAALVRELFEENPEITSKEMQEEVVDAFPKSKFKPSHFAYYKNKLQKDDSFEPELPTQKRGRKKKAEPAAKKKAATKKKTASKRKGKRPRNDSDDED